MSTKTEEQIKKELQELGSSKQNEEFLAGLRKIDDAFSDYLKSVAEYELLEKEDALPSEIGDALDDIETDTKRIVDKGEMFRKEFGPDLSKQIQSFFEGPEDSSDEKVHEWVKKNYLAVRLFACSRVLEANDKIKEDSKFFELCSLAKKMPAVVEMAKMYMLKHNIEAFADKNNLPDLPNDYEYEQIMESKLKEAKSQYNSPDKEGQRSLNEIKTVFAESGNYYENEKATFAKFADKLERAKTYRNSDEYNNLVESIKLLNQSDKYPRYKNGYKGERTDLHNYSMKLFIIKKRIDTYLSHKARDGVNKNVYNKLAAVEELNEYVSKRLEDLKPDFNEIENRDNKGPKFVNCAYTAWRENFEKAPADKEMPDKQRSVLNCMGRIIARAEKNTTVTKNQLKDLKGMYTAFGGISAPKKKPEEKAGPRIL